jgi:hypothetical protein
MLMQHKRFNLAGNNTQQKNKLWSHQLQAKLWQQRINFLFGTL